VAWWQQIEWSPFLLSFKLAGMTVSILFVIAIPFAWWLSQTRTRFKPLLEAMTALPIVLPPSVLGFYMLMLLSHNSPLGHFLEESFDIKLAFSFTGLVIASCFYSFPFMVQPLQSGFESLNPHMIEASYLAGKNMHTTLLKVAIPNIKPSLITALIISFAHTVGEFGVVLMVGGNIPDKTRVASVAIYDLVEVMDYDKANLYAGVLLLFSFSVLVSVYWFNYRHKMRVGTVL
jgi:molybdate transport system permease protein